MKEDKNESRWDKLLNIRTMGRDDTHADQYRYPYEPTPYSVPVSFTHLTLPTKLEV